MNKSQKKGRADRGHVQLSKKGSRNVNELEKIEGKVFIIKK